MVIAKRRNHSPRPVVRGNPPTQRRFEMLGCSHFTFAADGSVAQNDVYHDALALLRALGVLPEPRQLSRREASWRGCLDKPLSGVLWDIYFSSPMASRASA
jgi:hypothetical protein